jgi:hypothetical protein
MSDIEDDDTVRFSGEYYDRAEGYLFDFNSSMCQSNPYGNKVDTVMSDIEDDDTVRFSGEYYDRAEGYLFDFNSSMCQSNPYGNKVDTVVLNETDTSNLAIYQPVPSLKN